MIFSRFVMSLAILLLVGVAGYAIHAYEQLPPDSIRVAATTVKTDVVAICPAIDNVNSGGGIVFVAICAIAGIVVLGITGIVYRSDADGSAG
jgi:hypothetical protein